MDKLLHIHIPKTAGISIQKNGAIPIISFGHRTAANIKIFENGLIPSDKIFSFAICRNPYDRFMSSYYFYRDIYAGERDINTEIQKYTDFKDFVLSFNNFKYKDDLQFVLQTDFILDHNDKLLINYVGQFEIITQSWANICHLSGNEYYPLPIKNKSTHMHWRDEYTSKMKAVVYELFRKDFNYFKYKK